MKRIYTILFFVAVSVTIISCSKYVGPNDNTTNPTNPTTPTTPVVNPTVKFFSVMDNGSMTVKFNNKTASSIAKYYPSTYIQGVEGTNNLQLSLPNNTQLMNTSLTLTRDTKYSCFFYKVGNEWKYNLVKDEFTTPAAGFMNYRILDMRTQAYFDYINVRMVNPGSEIIDVKNRNFLDHVTYSGLSQFKQGTAGKYNIFMYNDTATTSQRKDVSIDSKGVYSVILLSPDNIVPYSNAVYYIFPDVVKHN